MGVDIYGWVEVRKVVGFDSPSKWVAICRIRELVDRNYDMFGALLDVRNNQGFATPFAHRGLPDDVSGWVKPEYDPSDVGVSWATWTEVDTLWDQIGEYDTGHLITLEQFESERVNPAFAITSVVDTPKGPHIYRTRIGHPEIGDEELIPTWYSLIGDCYIRTGRFTVRELISPGWQACFDVMAALAKNFGSDNVRLVAWCDMA